jgi:hypothetical protein
MFSIGNRSHSTLGSAIHSNDGSNDFENCPVIELHDTAEDVSNLFSALYDGPHFGNNDQDDFRVVSGILRLSTKYLIDSLRDKAIAHLSKAWPSTLKGWDIREDLARAYEMETGTSGARLYPSPLAVINLARQVDVPTLRPSAFFDLSRYTFSQIFDPCVQDSLYYPSDLPSQSPASSPTSPPPSISLSLSDTQRLCIGKEASQHAITSLIQSMSNSQSIRNSGLQLQSAFSLSHPLAHGHAPTVNSHHQSSALTHYHHHHRRSSSTAICISAAACRKDFSELVDLATKHYLFDRERGYSDPLYMADEIGGLKSEASECKACAKNLETWAIRERERIWRMIPTWFRLSSEAGFASPERTSSPPVPVVDIEA